MGNRARRLQRKRRRLGLFSARSCSLARLPLERRRHRRNFGLQRPALFCVRFLERTRPVSERALVRPDSAPGKSRRGCEGTLLVSRQHADAQFHAGDLSLSPMHLFRTRNSSRRTARVRKWNPSSKSGTPARSRKIVSSTSKSNTPKRTRDDILIRVNAKNCGPEPAPLHLLPTLWFRNTWSWGRNPTKPMLRKTSERSRHCSNHGQSSRAWRLRSVLRTRSTIFSSPKTKPTPSDFGEFRIPTPFVKDSINDRDSSREN